MDYGDFKDLPRRRASDTLLRDKVINIVKNPQYGQYQRRLASMVFKFLTKILQVVLLKSKLFRTNN